MTHPNDIPLGTLVMKFGGTSVGTPQAMAQTVEIVRQSRSKWPRLVVITSALATVTNSLLESATRSAQGETQVIIQNATRLKQLHYQIVDTLVTIPEHRTQVLEEIDQRIAEFASLCRAMSILGEATPRALDTVGALGERLSVRVLAAALQEAGVDAQAVESTCLIETDDCFQNAHPDFIASTRKTYQELDPLLAAGCVPVVTGFIGATATGITTTLGRGGSDYSAGILGSILPAHDVWIWTDVDGVMSADPRLVPEARTIPEITYREIAELAYFGAKVLHPKTIRPLVDAGIGLRICNTFNPSHPGTRLVPDKPADPNKKPNGKEIIKAVTAIRDQRLITVEGRGMLGVPGVAARTFAAVASTGTSVPLITQASSEQSICFAVPSSTCQEVIVALESTFAPEITRKDIDHIWATQGISIITVVGAGMIHTPGVAGQIFGALGAAEVNVIAIAQGSSEVSISLVVKEDDTEAAVKTVHSLILTNGMNSKEIQ
jgi:aspartokinase/homoserine dehydrogenase 1